jgi:hypothetical protein
VDWATAEDRARAALLMTRQELEERPVIANFHELRSVSMG